MHWEVPDVQAGFRKGRGTRDQIANICWIIKKARQFQRNIYICFLDYTKVFDCMDHNKLWKILKEMGIPDHLTCLLRNQYAGQEAKLEPDMEKQSGWKLSKKYINAVYCHPAYLYSEYIMWNARLDEAQAGIKIAKRNINNLRKADDTTLMAESKEELNSLLIKVRGEAVLRWCRNHFLPHKFNERSFEHWANSAKQRLNAGGGHQVPRKATHCLWKEVGQNRKDKKRDRRVRDGDPSEGGNHKREVSKYQETLSLVDLWGVLESQRAT